MTKFAFQREDEPGTGRHTVDFLTLEEGADNELQRLPEFDIYANDEQIPVQAFFDAGWSVGCVECWRLSDCEDEGCEEYPLPPVEDIIIGAYNYFCSTGCAESWLSRRRDKPPQ
jgi:hypothetical protein